MSSQRRQERTALDYVRLTVPQRVFLSDTHRQVIWRDGNQLGKSWALAYEIIHRMRGTHPFKRTHRPPIKAMVISISYEQILPLMEKIWALVPKDELSPKCSFDPGRGITGKPPRLVLVRGPGRGSELVFATYKQGTQRIAGGTVHFIALDEPPPENIWGEVQPRLRHFRGHLRCTFTPTPDMPDLKWLRKMVQDKAVGEHNFGLTEANCWLEGAEAPWLTQAELDAENKKLLRHEYEMRVNGAWEAIVTGAWLTTFTDANIQPARPGKGDWVGIGIDHGAAAGKQAGALVAIGGRSSLTPRVHHWDETLSDGYTTPEHDARALLQMLDRRDLEYDDVDEWVGDRPTGENKYLIRKRNKDLRRQLARLLKRPIEKTRMIRVPHKWAGSLTYGMRLLNSLFGTKHPLGGMLSTVDPRCEGFIEFCQTFAGDRADPTKDVGDAHRYIVERGLTHNASRLIRSIYA